MTSSKRNRSKHSQFTARMKRITSTKLEHRVKLANLPFPKKVEIIIKLQDIDNSLAKAAGRKPRKGWDI